MKIYNTLSLIAFVLFYRADALIHKVHSLDQISTFLANITLNMDSLVIFDVDSTLLYYDRQKVAHMVEPTTDRFVKALQAYTNVIALTGSYTGKSSDGSFLYEDKRRNELLKLNINFAMQWPKSYYFHNLKKIYQAQEQVPIFKYGILFTGAFKNHPMGNKYPAHSKGMVLDNFLHILGWRPSCIIMIDNSRHKLESVETFLRNYPISFQGFWYIRP